MLQLSRHLWRPSNSKYLLVELSRICAGLDNRAIVPTSCCTISPESAKYFSCNWRIFSRPSTLSWSIREAHTGTAGKSHGRRKKTIKQSSLQYTKRSGSLEERTVEDPIDEDVEKDSKGQSKRKALRAKEWGVALASLSPSQLRQAIRLASLSEETYDAVMLVKSLGPKVRNGKRRQFNYIGVVLTLVWYLLRGLLRDADPELMEEVLKVCRDGDPPGLTLVSNSAVELSENEDELSDVETQKVLQEDLAAHSTAQQWLEGLLGGNESINDEVFTGSNDVYFDRQELRRLIRTVKQTRDAIPSVEIGLGMDEIAPGSSVDRLKEAKKAEIALLEFLRDLAERRLNVSLIS